MKSALIIGADSVIGAAGCGWLKEKHLQVSSTTRRDLDLANLSGWPALPKTDMAVICAGVTKLEACERTPEAAWKVNVEGTAALAKKLCDAGAFVLFLSTNHVFDGTKPHRKATDAPCPINEYGRQKAETERRILALGNSAVLRLTKVIIPGDTRISAWHRDLSAKKQITAFDDIFLSPITLQNVLDAWLLIKKPGIYQLSGEEDFSYYDLARAIAQRVGADEALVTRSSGEAAGVTATFRPSYSSYEKQLDIAVPDIEGIIEYALNPDKLP